MALEDDLKKAMGYTEDTKQRCPNCTHCEVRGPTGAPEYWCTANKALEIPVSAEGRCNLFSAKRSRRSVDDDRQDGNAAAARSG